MARMPLCRTGEQCDGGYRTDSERSRRRLRVTVRNRGRRVARGVNATIWGWVRLFHTSAIRLQCSVQGCAKVHAAHQAAHAQTGRTRSHSNPTERKGMRMEVSSWYAEQPHQLSSCEMNRLSCTTGDVGACEKACARTAGNSRFRKGAGRATAESGSAALTLCAGGCVRSDMVTGTAMLTTADKKVLAASWDSPSCGGGVDGTCLGVSMRAQRLDLVEAPFRHIDSPENRGCRGTRFWKGCWTGRVLLKGSVPSDSSNAASTPH